MAVDNDMRIGVDLTGRTALNCRLFSNTLCEQLTSGRSKQTSPCFDGEPGIRMAQKGWIRVRALKEENVEQRSR